MNSTGKVLTLSVPVPDGATTEETFTVSVTMSSVRSLSSARTSALWTFLGGLENSKGNVQQTAVDSVPWSISEKESLTPASSTPHSHSGCWCNSYRKQATDDVDG